MLGNELIGQDFLLNVYFPLDFEFSFFLFTRENLSHWSDLRYIFYSTLVSMVVETGGGGILCCSFSMRWALWIRILRVWHLPVRCPSTIFSPRSSLDFWQFPRVEFYLVFSSLPSATVPLTGNFHYSSSWKLELLFHRRDTRDESGQSFSSEYYSLPPVSTMRKILRVFSIFWVPGGVHGGKDCERVKIPLCLLPRDFTSIWPWVIH